METKVFSKEQENYLSQNYLSITLAKDNYVSKNDFLDYVVKSNKKLDFITDNMLTKDGLKNLETKVDGLKIHNEKQDAQLRINEEINNSSIIKGLGSFELFAKTVVGKAVISAMLWVVLFGGSVVLTGTNKEFSEFYQQFPTQTSISQIVISILPMWILGRMQNKKK